MSFSWGMAPPVVSRKRSIDAPGRTVDMILLLLALLPQTAVERYLEEKDKGVRAKILAEIKAPIAEVEAELRTPPKRASVEARGQIVKKKLKADHPLAVEFEVVLWVPKDYEPEKSWRLI